jgi:hypothetical protein
MWCPVTGRFVPSVSRQHGCHSFSCRNILCSSAEISTLKEEAITLAQNVRHNLPSDTAPHPKRMQTSTAPLWKPSNLHTSKILLCPVWIHKQIYKGYVILVGKMNACPDTHPYLSKLMLPSGDSWIIKVVVKSQDIKSDMKVVVSEPDKWPSSKPSKWIWSVEILKD